VASRATGFVAVRIEWRARSSYEVQLILRGRRIDQRRTRPMLGFKSFRCARILLAGVEPMLTSPQRFPSDSDQGHRSEHCQSPFAQWHATSRPGFMCSRESGPRPNGRSTEATFSTRLLRSFASAIAAPYRLWSNALAELKDTANASKINGHPAAHPLLKRNG
jgi:hypothetical protein